MWAEKTKSGDKDRFRKVVGNASKRKVNKSLATGIVKKGVAPEEKDTLR